MQCNNGVAQEHNATVRRHRVESVCGWTRGQRGGIGLGKKIGIYERPNLRRVGLHPGNSTLTDIREERRFSSFGFLILSRQTSLRHPQRPDEIRHFCHFLTEGYYRTEGGNFRKSMEAPIGHASNILRSWFVFFQDQELFISLSWNNECAFPRDNEIIPLRSRENMICYFEIR